MSRITGKAVLNRYKPGVRKYDFFGRVDDEFRNSDAQLRTNSKESLNRSPKILYYVESDSKEVKSKLTLLF